jgi:predicted aldo/keto reductase-like oxidoreductase
MDISRRGFLEGIVATGAALPCALAAESSTTTLPARILGKTGARVSIVALGAGSRFLMYKDEDQALAAAKQALDAGITYIDSSDDYGKDHLSERRIGKVLKGRRQGIFLATKLSNRNGAESRRVVEESLRALQVDQVDLIHIHSLTSEDDLASIEAKGGVLEQLMKMRDEKLMRFIGITSHTDAAVLRTALERHDFDCTQMALNGARTGMKSGSGGMVPNRQMNTSFEGTALPVATKKNMGVIAMKVFAQDALLPHARPENLLRYSLSLPVATAVLGMPKLEHIAKNVELAKNFQPLSPGEMKQLSDGLAVTNKAELDRFFSTHVDA